MRARHGLLGLVLMGCAGESAPEVFEPEFSGPFVYDNMNTDGHWMLDTLWILSEQAVSEIEVNKKSTPIDYLDWRIDAMNDTIERSLITTSRVRSLGIHVLQDADFERVQQWMGDTNVTISNALSWLGTYRDTYGADKVMIVAGTEEGASGAALGGGDVSAHWVDFLPVEHEFGHQMGAAHCNKGQPGELYFGQPTGGYTDDGFAVKNSPIGGGTRMCGNNIAYYSNPDVRLTLDEIDEMIAQELMPEGDWASLIEDDGRVPMGHPDYANFAAHWMTVDEDASNRLPVVRYDGAADEPNANDDCIALFTDEGYGGERTEVCAGEDMTGLEGISSVKVGRNVHANLYSDASFGSESMCGGQLQRLPWSSPSLAALTAHHEVASLDDRVRSVRVYEPMDRAEHAYSESPYTFHGHNGTYPRCGGDDGGTLTIMPDGRTWSATAATYDSPVPIPFVVDFRVKTTHDGKNPPADAFTVFFGKAEDAFVTVPPTRDQQGVAVDGTGSAVEFNIWTNSVTVRDSNWEAVGEPLGFSAYTDGKYVPVSIEVRESSVAVMWDGKLLLEATGDFSSQFAGAGFTAGTGAYTMGIDLQDVTWTALP